MGKNEWTNTIDTNLLQIHMDLAVIAARLNILQGGTRGAGGTQAGQPLEEGPEGRTGEEVEGQFYPDVEPAESTEQLGTQTAGLVQATYAIRTATIAMRGYLMLLDQMHLSRDQKKMIMELQNVMMMVMKLMQVIRLLQAVSAAGGLMSGDPMAIFDLILAGGFGASSIAYGRKIGGSGT